MRFLCDEMLQKLGRWLRAAGYDTAIAASGSDDRVLLTLAAVEGRTLLTRDRKLAALAGESVAVLALQTDGVEASARELRNRLTIDWLQAPFTRCLVDNTILRPATEPEREAMPPRAKAVGGDVNLCPECGRLYWPGSHVRRMQAKLVRWAEEEEVMPPAA